MHKLCISYDQPKFECLSSSYKQDSELAFLCYVNKVHAIFISYIYIGSIYQLKFFLYLLICFEHE